MSLTVRISYDWQTSPQSVLDLLHRPSGAYQRGSERAFYYDAKDREEAHLIRMAVEGQPGMRVEILQDFKETQQRGAAADVPGSQSTPAGGNGTIKSLMSIDDHIEAGNIGVLHNDPNNWGRLFSK